MFFKGTISQDILSGMAESLIDSLYNKIEKKTSKKMFSVFIELAQNINRYSIERIPDEQSISNKTIGVGIIVVNEVETEYHLMSGNLVDNSTAEKLKNYINFLNSCEDKKLKELRKTKLKEDREAGAKGAGVGLIEIVRKAGSIGYQISKQDDKESFITFIIPFGKK
jgi:hypothetical protein